MPAGLISPATPIAEPVSPPRRLPRRHVSIGAAAASVTALAPGPSFGVDWVTDLVDIAKSPSVLPVLPWAAGAAVVVLGGIGLAVARRRSRRARDEVARRSEGARRAVSATERTVLLDPVDAETHEAMDRLSDTVRSHDLGGAPADPSNAAAVDSHDLVPAGRLLSETELDAAPRGELREQVRIVSNHNAKLHKVVIAQQASLKSARDSVDHHRSVARRARDETRVALEHKRIAVKLARRERAERVRVTDAYERTETALSNAMTMLRPTERARVRSGDAATQRAPERVASDSETGPADDPRNERPGWQGVPRDRG